VAQPSHDSHSLDQAIESLLADEQYRGHPLREALAELWRSSNERLARLERITKISDHYQSMAQEQVNSISERYRRQLRRIEKVIRISDRYQGMLQDLNLDLQSARREAEAANQAKSSYLSVVSHELRTPLNTVLGYAQLLESNPELSPGARQAASAIRRNGDHLADVIEGLLDISKIEAKRVDLQRGPVNLRALLEHLVEASAMKAKAKRLDFVYLPAPGLPEWVLADEKRLRQVLTNLLSNALKYTQEGQISLNVGYRSGVASFVIADSGVGIAEQDRSRIFEPFTRIQDERTAAIKGTGLGLTIARLLSSLMGGDIELDSRIGQGSTFTFKLLLPSTRPEPGMPSLNHAIDGYLGPRRTILVVDDQDDHRGLLRDFLTPLGFQVREARCASACLGLLDEFTPDLFVLDVLMPVTDGWQLLEQLRARRNDAPVIMLSANTIESHGKMLGQQSHNAYLVKPVRLDQLLRKIGELLQLDWVGQAATGGESTGAPSGRVLSSEESAQLVGMAKIGFLSGIQQQLDRLEQGGVDTARLTRLREMTQRCDFIGFIQAIEGSAHDAQ